MLAVTLIVSSVVTHSSCLRQHAINKTFDRSSEERATSFVQGKLHDFAKGRNTDSDRIAEDIENAIVNEDCDPDEKDITGNAPVHCIAKPRGHFHDATNGRRMMLFLTNGANPNVQDTRGCTVLHVAAEMNRSNLMQTVFKFTNELSIDVRSLSVVAGVHFENPGTVIVQQKNRAKRGLLSVQRAILKNIFGYLKPGTKFIFADANVQNKSGETALHVAAEGGHAACLKLLLSNGADRSIKDKKGCTALDAANNRRNYILERTSFSDTPRHNGVIALLGGREVLPAPEMVQVATKPTPKKGKRPKRCSIM